MFSQLLGFLLLIAYQVTINESRVTQATHHEHDTEGIPTKWPEYVKPLPEGYTYFPDVRTAYKIYPEPSTWYEGRDRCIAEGTQLANADSVDKIKHIKSLKTTRDKWIHVGFYRDETSTKWVAVDSDTPVSETSLPWVKDNPDGTGSCVGISMSRNGLLDYGCEWEGEYFACEIPL